MLNILVLDIETAPKLAYVWKFFKENIGPKQVKEHGHIMSYAAKWLGKPDIIYQENRKENDFVLIKSLCDLLDEADIVVAHNGKKFDLAQIRGRALVGGIKPPSPVKIIDTFLVAKKEFAFPSNSLEYLCEVMGCRHKKQAHKKFAGFELWLECLRGNEEAWAEMREYNVADILALEDLYLKMRPWITDHPIMQVDQDVIEDTSCPKCGSVHVKKRGFAYTNVGKYPRYRCDDCGGWSRGRYSTVANRKLLLTNQVS